MTPEVIGCPPPAWPGQQRSGIAQVDVFKLAQGGTPQAASAAAQVAPEPAFAKAGTDDDWTSF